MPTGPGPRITVLVDTFPEISETFIAEEVRALLRLGATVHVEALGPARNPDPDAARELGAHVTADETTAVRLRAVARLVARHPLRALADLAARRRWGREEQPLPLRALAPLALRVTARGDVHVHAHFGAGAALTAMRVARLTGIPYSVTLHGYDIFLTPMNLGEKLAGATFATSGSDYTVGELRRMHPAAAEKLHRIVMGVDGRAWTRSDDTREDGLVVAVGRLVEKKGLTHLLDAVALLRDEPAFGRLVIVGDGPLRESLTAQIGALDVGDLVELAGARPSREVRALVERAAVVAIPAVVAPSGDRDSMPVIAKEALALEVPVVASDVAGLPEIVAEPWGALVPPADPPALAAALAAVLRLTPEERAARGRAGREHVVRHCDVTTETRKLLDLVVGSVRRPRPPSSAPR